MLVYRDMTFCKSYESCATTDCAHRLTEDVFKASEETGLPLMTFVGIPFCHVPKNPTEEEEEEKTKETV